MASDLTVDMIQLMVRALMILVDETPAIDANRVVLQRCKDTVEWLEAQAHQIDNRPETTEKFSTCIDTVSQMIDRANEHARAKAASRTPEEGQVEPFDLAKLLASWDRDFPGGSAAVLANLEEIFSRVNARKENKHISKDE